MKTPQALFSNYIDQVCGMFGCMEATGPLKAGFQALCESTHTARAVEVHKWVKQAKEKIQDWIDSERRYIERSGGKCEPLSNPIHIGVEDIPFPEDALEDENFDWDPGLAIRLSFVADHRNRTGASYDRDDNFICLTVKDLIRRWKGTCLQYRRDFTAETIDKVEALEYELENGSTINNTVLDGFEVLINSGVVTTTLTHELTHFVQGLHGELGNQREEVAKYGIAPEDYDPSLHHEFMPWEIDADVHGHIARMVRQNLWEPPAYIAKNIYDIFINSAKNKGRIPEPLKQQCWKTAASLARAISLAANRDDADPEDIDYIISHIDDYAV